MRLSCCQISDSRTSLPAASNGRNRTTVDHSRTSSTSSAGDDSVRRASGYLQPLVGGTSGGSAAGHPSKYLQLLNSSTSTSTPQLSAIRRHAAASKDRDDRRRRPDYSPLVCDGNDSSGTSLAADTPQDTAQRVTSYCPLRPGPSPLYGRHAAADRRVQSMNCDEMG